MNIEPINKISEITRHLFFTSEKLNDLVHAVDHEILQNKMGKITMNLQNELFNMNNLCYEILNCYECDIELTINNCS